MIVLRVEVWPDGSEKGAKEIGRLEISNDETGTAEWGNYLVATTVQLPGDRRSARVEGFNRTRRTAWDLAYLSLRALVGRRNP